MKKLWMILASVALLCACSEDATDEKVGPETRISIGFDAMEFLASGEIASGENAVGVTSSGDWRLSGKKTWCTPSAVAGKNGDKVRFTAEENPTDEPRSVVFTFFCGDKTVTLEVTQHKSYIVDISQDEFTIPAAGEADIRIRLTSNVALSAEIDADGMGWMSFPTTRSSEQSFLHLKVAPNDTYGFRSGKVVLTGEGIEPRTITVSQVQNDALQVDQNKYKQPLEASTVRMTVWSNIPYEVRIPAEYQGWVTLAGQPSVPTGWSSQELVFSLAAAADYRIFSVSLVSTDGKRTIPIEIQQGEPLVFQVPDANFLEVLLSLQYISAIEGGYTTTATGVAATTMDAYNTLNIWNKKGCESLSGIEYFPNVTTLVCWYSRIRVLDVSKNTKLTQISQIVPNPFEEVHLPPSILSVNFAGKLYDYYNKINSYTYVFSEKLVITGEQVQLIDLSDNKLKTLDVSGCPALNDLRCTQDGKTLTTIYMAESQRDQVTLIKDPDTQIVYR